MPTEPDPPDFRASVHSNLMCTMGKFLKKGRNVFELLFIMSMFDQKLIAFYDKNDSGFVIFLSLNHHS